ncbi:tRNA lysidine(34) synthetase TilS [Cardinium endosymbiont of Tipula unca]|uniref:tRNA lysidine(34) synthetase TilS n=1 Tax=Cardinium endosymbiont of Tipula unca TaxID=3066216 RepID=UPI0030CEA12A
MLTLFLSFLQKQKLITDTHQETLLAVSGGVDSIVLCYLFKQAGLPFAIAHCNFNLRGKEADEETQFVHGLAQYYKVAFYSTKFETKDFASENSVSTQMAARTLRYHFFHSLLEAHGLNQIATAHHWDDAVETILLNLIKGTGIGGFAGIPSINGKIIRPLLFARKQEIINYAKQENLIWREDSSNKDIYYQRNLIRNKVIPLLHNINPNFEETTKDTCKKLRDIGKLFESQVHEIKKEILSFRDGLYYMAIDQIAHLPWATTVSFEILRFYGFTFEQIKNLITEPKSSGKVIYSKDYVLSIDRKQWIIGRKAASNPPTPPKNIAKETEQINFDSHTLQFKAYERHGYQIQKTPMVAALDYHALLFPLIVRPWKNGDTFYPLGMKGRKKVSDLLIDLKMPIAIKKKVWVLTTSSQIIWVIGYRMDERFKVCDTTKKILEVVWSTP